MYKVGHLDDFGQSAKVLDRVVQRRKVDLDAPDEGVVGRFDGHILSLQILLDGCHFFGVLWSMSLNHFVSLS